MFNQSHRLFSFVPFYVILIADIRNCVTAHGGWPARIHAGNASRILTAPDFYTGGGRSIF
ncbi:hypothetical protein ANACOL_01350 [Anaerotruncus colihominis DSM 17241]|uniref:Uncharacterized protein n=1 Tax=Anaerotruncus colihominis DSM 17241 TaxID=445972 RepID=B0P9A3_9FIRM|nr:hypothetical protein ANACOL_01350 [Anaerotruncus colihominis DSM 17241]